MRNLIGGKLLLVGVCWLGGLAAWSQDAHAPKPKASALEVAVTYDATRGNVTTGTSFWMQGGSVQVHGQFWRGLGAVAEVSGAHTADINSTGVGIDLVTATFGPRYTWRGKHARYSFFGQALAGEAFGLHGTFPATPSAVADTNSLATQLGGGINVTVSRLLSLRAMEASWLRSQVPNATNNVQNNLKVGAGIVLRLP